MTTATVKLSAEDALIVFQALLDKAAKDRQAAQNAEPEHDWDKVDALNASADAADALWGRLTAEYGKKVFAKTTRGNR